MTSHPVVYMWLLFMPRRHMCGIFRACYTFSPKYGVKTSFHGVPFENGRLFAISINNSLIALVSQLKDANYCLWCSFHLCHMSFNVIVRPFFCTCLSLMFLIMAKISFSWRIEAISEGIEVLKRIKGGQSGSHKRIRTPKKGKQPLEKIILLVVMLR